MNKFGRFASVLCLSIILGAISSVDAKRKSRSVTSSQGCFEYCGDYHKICRVVKDPAQLAQFEADSQKEEVTKFMPYSKFPQPDCNHILYHLLCPHSCGSCVPCIDSKLASLSDEVQKLTQTVTQLTSNQEQFKVKEAETRAAASPVDLALTAHSSSPIFGGFPLAQSLDNNPNSCFITAADKGGWSKYSLPDSYVTVVKVQNRPDCCPERMNGNEVYVCSDETDESCSKCGALNNVPQGGWGQVTCNKRGTIVKLLAPTSYLQVTQVAVLGATI